MRTRFPAPWGRELAIVTAIGLLGVGIPAVVTALRGALIISMLMIVILVSVFSQIVRDYYVTPDALKIRRPFWTTSWPIDSRTRASFRPEIMTNSWRIWGNGGFFSITGRFSNSALGRYHAYVTDFSRTVVLDTPRGIVVVSPDDPYAFMTAVAEVVKERS